MKHIKYSNDYYEMFDQGTGKHPAAVVRVKSTRGEGPNSEGPEEE